MEDLKTLDDLMKYKGLIMVPASFDALSAKLIEDMGFLATSMSGFGTSISQFGLPDRGLISFTEMVQTASRIVDAINIPLIADAETGFGNPLNVIRTVQLYEKAGVAGLHIEDQEWPKRCGHMAGKSVIEAEEMVQKVKAAVENRKSDTFGIIARTDALATHGFDEAIERCKMYLEAGADMVFMDGLARMVNIKKLPKLLTKRPNILNMGPRTPNIPADQLKAMGYKIVNYPGLALVAKILSIREDLKNLKETGIPRSFFDIVTAIPHLNQLFGDAQYTELEKRYTAKNLRM